MIILLNVPSTKEGLIHENDINRIKEFGNAIKRIFEGKTIGYKRLVRLESVCSKKIIIYRR